MVHLKSFEINTSLSNDVIIIKMAFIGFFSFYSKVIRVFVFGNVLGNGKVSNTFATVAPSIVFCAELVVYACSESHIIMIYSLHVITWLCNTSKAPPVPLYSICLASHPYFPRGAHARGKGGGGREGKICLVRCARFSFCLLECWQSQSNLSIQSN